MGIFVWTCVSPLFKTIIATLTVLSSAALVRDEFFTEWNRYHIVQFLPNCLWQTWLLLLLSVTFIGFGEGALHLHLQHLDGRNRLVDAIGRPLGSSPDTAPITRYVAGAVIVVIVAIWAYGVLFPPEFVTITGAISMKLKRVPKGQPKSLAGVIRYFDSEIASDIEKYPYALKVIVQFSEFMQLQTLRFECDSTISEAVLTVSGIAGGPTKENIEETICMFDVHNIGPDHPVVAILYSTHKLKLKNVSRFY